MTLTQADVEKIALLSRLRLTPEELAAMTTQLDQIVGYVHQLSELNTDDVEPMAHAVELRNVFAEDVERPSLPREEALANAPRHDDACFLAPPVLGEG